MEHDALAGDAMSRLSIWCSQPGNAQLCDSCDIRGGSVGVDAKAGVGSAKPSTDADAEWNVLQHHEQTGRICVVFLHIFCVADSRLTMFVRCALMHQSCFLGTKHEPRWKCFLTLYQGGRCPPTPINEGVTGFTVEGSSQWWRCIRFQSSLCDRKYEATQGAAEVALTAMKSWPKLDIKQSQDVVVQEDCPCGANVESDDILFHVDLLLLTCKQVIHWMMVTSFYAAFFVCPTGKCGLRGRKDRESGA
jgi:hypothetical protein